MEKNANSWHTMWSRSILLSHSASCRVPTARPARGATQRSELQRDTLGDYGALAHGLQGYRAETDRQRAATENGVSANRGEGVVDFHPDQTAGNGRAAAARITQTGDDMYNVIGIWGDGSERIIGTGFASWCEAFDWAVAYQRSNVASCSAAHWYRFDAEPVA